MKEFWTAAAVVVPALIALFSAYWWLTKQAVKLGVTEALLVVAETYATKKELEKEMEGHVKAYHEKDK